MPDQSSLDVVILDYNELLCEPTPELLAKIEKAYGYHGLGLLAIRGVPGYIEKRAKGLPFAYRFGTLPDNIKNKYEHPESTYSFGWSHGKEKLEGKPDLAKGSYYANPTYDRPIDDPTIIKQYSSFVHPNIWPSNEDCPGFEAAFKSLGQTIVDTGILLTKACDAYVKTQLPLAKPNRVGEIITNSRCTKARLLFYFPVPSKSSSTSTNTGTTDEDEMSSWCGWHNDHGSLTGLTSAMYFDAQGNEIPCPDPKAGLYIRTRTGVTIRGVIPADCIAYQIGETSQVHTGGVLQATPHCVRAAEVEGVSRGTLAVFMEPMWDEYMSVPPGSDPEQVLKGAKGELLPKGVPKLVDRWTGDEQSFGQFTDKTLASYY